MANPAWSVRPAAPDGETRSAPVDLVELARRTFGDTTLEREVLGMFAAQARIHVQAILQSRDAETRRRAAHTLKGAARAIGAGELARCAERAERIAWDEPGALAHEANRVCDYIAALLGDRAAKLCA
jgi:HPt (histidine-containing phosphotransfer) domain-containing protein